MAVDTGQGRVRARPGGAGLPVAFEGAVMAYATEDPPVLGPLNVQVPRPVHARLSALQRQLRVERGRPVSYGEVVEWLLDYYQREEDHR